MAPNKKKCPNGHLYDGNIYGDNCPFCPNPTQVNNVTGGRTQINTTTSGAEEPTRQTTPMNSEPAPNVSGGGHTLIRPAGGDTNDYTGRRLVGILVSYNVNPNGEVYKLYEGRNTIGRDRTNDISFSHDNAISSEHLIIAYRDADGRFLMEDRLTSNGTWHNGNFVSDRVTLVSNDIIVIGSTKLVFWAIPTTI